MRSPFLVFSSLMEDEEEGEEEEAARLRDLPPLSLSLGLPCPFRLVGTSSSCSFGGQVGPFPLLPCHVVSRSAGPRMYKPPPTRSPRALRQWPLGLWASASATAWPALRVCPFRVPSKGGRSSTLPNLAAANSVLPPRQPAE